MTQDLDKRTGRPYGDHGTAVNAIDFALNHERTGEIHAFLKGWMEGSLDEWPEFYAWLRTQAPKETPPPLQTEPYGAERVIAGVTVEVLLDQCERLAYPIRASTKSFQYASALDNCVAVIKDLAEKNEKLRGDLLMSYLKAPSPEVPASIEEGPLKDLGLCVGDVVQRVSEHDRYSIPDIGTLYDVRDESGYWVLGLHLVKQKKHAGWTTMADKGHFRVVSRAATASPGKKAE